MAVIVSERSGMWFRVAAVLLLLALMMRLGGWQLFNMLELELLTLRQRLYANQAPPHESPVVIVAIDSATQNAPEMNRLFGRATQDRSMYGYAVRFLNRSQPKAVVFDMSFNGGADFKRPEGDRYFASSMPGSHNVISTLMFDHDPSNSVSWAGQSSAVRSALQKSAVAVTGLKQVPFGARYGFSSLIPPFQLLLDSGMRFCSARTSALDNANDSTSTLRRWSPLATYGGRVFPSVPLCAVTDSASFTLSKAGRLSWPGGHVDLGHDGAPLVKWYRAQHVGQHPTYREYHFWDVLASELSLQCRENPSLPVCKVVPVPKTPPLSPELFRDKYVLINFTWEGAFDFHKTVYGGQYPGVYIVANELDNLLRHDFVYPAPWWQNGLLSLLMLGLALWVCLRFSSPLWALTAVSALGVMGFGGTYLAYARLNLWLNLAYPLVGLVLVYSVTYAWRFIRTERRRQQLRTAFGKYVSPAVMMNLEKNQGALRLGGQRRELTLLFCDIRGFTSFSEAHEPEVVERFLIQYFSVMNNIIKNTYQGSINKLMGDAIMAYWGFPLEDQDQAFLAVSAALAMRDALEDWHKNPDNPALRIGVGINTGEVVIGNIGSEDFMDFTVIGDAVNLAARLESMNKEYGSTIIISESTYQKIKDRVDVRSLGTVTVRGKSQETAIYEPVALRTTEKSDSVSSSSAMPSA
jgi:adenylate cyclase